MTAVPHAENAAQKPPHRILIASYYFPPDSAVGGLRSAKFARALREFGWEPYVLTVKDKYRNQGLDPGRLNGLEGIPIARTNQFPSLRQLYSAASSRVRRVSGSRVLTDEPGPRIRQPAQRLERETLPQRIRRYVVSCVVLLPDTKKNWALYAAFEAIRLIRRHRIEYVLTSAPPFSVHLIGLMAKAFTDVRWIADFRDPWVESMLIGSTRVRSKASDAIETWMESTVIRGADKVVTTTERLRDALRVRYTRLPSDKFVCVSNSIATEHFGAADSVEKYSTFTITYAGTLYFDRTPEPLFRAVGELIRAGKITDNDIRIKLVGNCQYIDGVATRSVAKRYGLERVVEVVDSVPYAEAIRIMQKSHLLLIIAPERHRLMVGAKLFDYLGSGSRILGLAEQGATADLIEATKGGRCFSLSEEAALRDYLNELIRDRRFDELKNDVEAFRHYDLRYLTGRLVAEMSALDPKSFRIVESVSG